MIIVRITGGLGNQLFQYAAARRIAHLHDTRLKLDISYYDHSLRQYNLKYFNIVGKIASTDEIQHIKTKNCFAERLFSYDPEILKVSSNTYLKGRWQSEKYFKDIEPIIRRELSLKYGPDQANKEMANQISGCKAVAVHLRRGDYITKPWANSNLGTCPLEYYHDAIKKLKGRLKNPHFFIFSDDWIWVKDNLKINNPATLVTLNKEDKCYEDLRLMSLCKHHIIANSTFSWWGAWLADYQDKIVFYPKKWFQNESFDLCDLIPDSWKVCKKAIDIRR